MSTIETIYLGDLQTEARHLKSGNKLLTDAPVDNQGKGSAFSPTDLLATSLGSCMLTVIGIAARTRNFEEKLKGTRIAITKIMKSDPRRVGEIIVEFYFPPNDFQEKEKKIIERSAHTCPVSLSLAKELEKTLIFNY